jgi:hypothetical protein
MPVDHAWIPGHDADSLMAKQLYRDRVLAPSLDTHVVDLKTVKLLTDLYTELEFTSSVVKPIGDLLLISHGNDSGWMSLDLDSAAATTTSFQELKKILDPANVHRKTALRIPPTLYTTSAGTVGPTRVLLGGCRVGGAPKFVDALKDVLGGVLPIVAPKHFHMFSPRIRRLSKKKFLLLGTYEFLCYAFGAISTTPLGRTDLKKALHDNPKNVTIDGHPVPDASWEGWLPKTLPRGMGKFAMPVTVPLGRKIEKQTTISPGQFRHQPGKYTVRFPNPTAAQRTQAGLKAGLAAHATMQPAWGFPEYEQYGHDTFDEFFASFTWTRPKKNLDPQVWTGLRHEYLVLVPITSIVPADKGKLLYNFFPPRTGSTLTAIKELDETDPRLFYRTP